MTNLIISQVLSWSIHYEKLQIEQVWQVQQRETAMHIVCTCSVVVVVVV